MRTSLYSVLCIVIRLGAVLLAVNTAVGFPAAYLAASSGNFGDGALGALLGFSGALLAVATLLWLFPGILARLAAGQSSRQVFESPLGAREFQYIAFAVLGLGFAMGGLVDLVGFVMRSALTLNLDDAYLRREDWVRVVPQALKLVLGVALAAGSRGLADVLCRLRETGLSTASRADSRDAADSK